MIRYIPSFILYQYEREAYTGDIPAYVIVFDIVDFTNSCSRLFTQDKGGVETLSLYLDSAFHQPIESLIYYGGFVAGFSGDACTVIMPQSDPKDVLSAVKAIQHYFQGITQFKGIYLKIRLSVSYGNVHWQIYENKHQNEYVFMGEAYEDMIQLQSARKDLIFSRKAARQIGIEGFSEIEGGWLPQAEILQQAHAKSHTADYEFVVETRKRFCHERLQGCKLSEEHRQAGYSFISLQDLPESDLPRAISEIDRQAHKYNGMVNKLENADKGFLAIVLFGIPHNRGHFSLDLCKFALELIQTMPKLRIGISIGYVLACYTGSGVAKEYTAFGHPMNLAARLMAEAYSGQVLTDTYLRKELDNKFYFSSVKKIPLKGLTEPIECFDLRRAVAHDNMFSRNQFVGREKEKEFLRENILQGFTKRENAIIYVHGDPGMGKSVLIEQVVKELDQESCSLYEVKCDDIDVKELDLIKQLLSKVAEYNPWNDHKKNKAKFHGLWEDLARGDKEMLRIESIIGSVWGYEWPESSWVKLSEKEKPQQFKEAFTYMMGFLAATKPILISLEDAQWIDPASKSFLQALSKTKAAPIVIISSCRYVGKETVDLKLPNHRKVDLEIKRFNLEETASLISSLLHPGTQAPKETVKFIDSYAQGTPLFVQQLTLDMQEHRKLDEKGVLLSKEGYSRNLKIDNVIDSRIDHLTANVRNALDSAAVLGNRFYVEVLSRMLDTKLDIELEQGTRERIWLRYTGQENSDSFSGITESQYMFYHAMIQNSAYKRMMKDKLYTLHYAAARAMERVYLSDIQKHWEEIARHYEKANLLEIAASVFCRAGDYYKSKHDYIAAARCFKAAFEAKERLTLRTDSSASRPDTVPTINNWAEQLINIGGQQQVSEAAQKLEYAREVNEICLSRVMCDKASTLILQAKLMSDSRNYQEAVNLLNQALTIQKKHLENTDPLLGTTLHELGNLYSNKGEPKKAESSFKQAIHIWSHCGREVSPEMADSMNDLARFYSNWGKKEDAESLFVKALDMRRKTLGNEHIDLTETLNDYADFLIANDQFPKAEGLLDEALRIRIKIMGENSPLVADTYHSMGWRYLELNEYELAQSFFWKAYSIQEKNLGPDNLESAETMQSLADTYLEKSKFADALEFYQKVLSIREKMLPPEHEDIAETLLGMGNTYMKLTRSQEAEACYDRAESILSKVFSGLQHTDLATSYNDHANNCIELGEYKEAEVLLLKALSIRERICGKESLDAAESMNNLARVYIELARYEESEQLFLKALNIREQESGENSIEVAETYNDLARLYIDMKDKTHYHEAESLLLKALAIRKQKYKPVYIHAEIAETMNELAMLYIEMEEWDKANYYLKRAMVIRRKVMGYNTSDYADCLDVLANLLNEKGFSEESSTISQEALAVRAVAQGQDHPDYAETMNTLGTIYTELNQHAKAEELLKKALNIRRKTLGDDHPDVAESMNDLADSLLEQEKYSESEDYFGKAINIRQKSCKDNLDVAETWHDMALLHIETGKYDSAEQLLINSRQIREAIHGYNHSEVAESINDLARLYFKQGLYKKAIPLFEEALKLRETELDPWHLDVADTLNDLGCLYYELDQYDQARLHFLRALEIRKNKLGVDNPDTLETQANLDQLNQQALREAVD